MILGGSPVVPAPRPAPRTDRDALPPPEAVSAPQPGTTMYRITELERVTRTLEDDVRDAFALIRRLDRLRPTCVICTDATADRQTSRGPACTDCAGDLPGDGAGPADAEASS